MNLKNIIQGFGSYLSGKQLTPEQQKRAEICNTCPLAKLGESLEETPDGDIKQVKGGICTKCGCFLPAKIRVNNERCPIDKWIEIDE